MHLCTVNLYLKCQRNQKKKKESGVEEVTMNYCNTVLCTLLCGSCHQSVRVNLTHCLSFTAGHAHTYADALINNAHFPHVFSKLCTFESEIVRMTVTHCSLKINLNQFYHTVWLSLQKNTMIKYYKCLPINPYKLSLFVRVAYRLNVADY